MIFRFVADYSQSSALRQEFAADPNRVLDRYGISQPERQPLLAGDREKVSRQLHAEIDSMLSGANDVPIIWPVDYPRIVGQPIVETRPAGQPVRITIPALNLASEIKVRFHQGSRQVDAEVLEVEHAAGVYTIHCQAMFPEAGPWDVEFVNLVDGEPGDYSKNYFTLPEN